MDRILGIWKRLTPNQRMVLVLCALGVVALGALLATWAGHPDYQVLYSGLKPEDGGRIVEKLRSRKVPFQLRDGGATVLVPAQNVYETRLDLATAGLPQSGGVGYEVFDKNNFGMTDFVQKLNYQRALEGELTRTIQGLEEVEQARVHIVIPEPHLYTEERTTPTASVVLKLHGRLNPGQVQGITHLVASSVEGLKPEDITVIDTNGNVLSKGHSESTLAGLSNDQLELQQNVETYLARKVQTMLEGVLGNNHAVVQVSAQLDFDKIESTVEKYDPDNPVVRSEEKNDTQGQTNGEKTTSSVVNYEVSKSVEHIANATGGIRKLSVAVMVDGSYQVDAKGARKYTPRSAEEMTKIQNIVRSAVGIDARRGDELEVANVAFDTSALDEVQKDMKKAQTMGLLTKVGGKLGMLAVGVVLLLFLRSALKGVAGAVRPSSAPEELAEGSQDLVQINRRRMEERISRLARERPQEVALLVRSWMREENPN
ncbi:MAG TPA: flagellar basal-body MS-ring/collar protein FliF [Candidatus Saccharimonadales bacterium]|nr:flagellar basal-body MS-ring/collar protein FliF [Candidatus Saccharimonadales bacterium]